MGNNLIEKYNEIGNFIENAESRINNILKTLNWNVLATKKESNFVDETPEDTTSSPLNSQLYSQLYPESIATTNSIKLDQKLLKEIISKPKLVPESVTDYDRDFTTKEKLKIYEYVISKTKKLIVPEIKVLSKEDLTSKEKSMTFAELVAFKRDLKRRPLKNRATKAPPLSLNEELRNLIDIQMQAVLEHKVNQNTSSTCDKSADVNIKDDKIKSNFKKPFDLKESRLRNTKRSKSKHRLEKYNSKNKETKIKEKNIENNTKTEYKFKKRKRSRSLSIDISYDEKICKKSKKDIKSPENSCKKHKTHKKHKKHKKNKKNKI